MSYILDALRRADAERDRGAVPGLHAQSAFAAGSGVPAAAAGTRRPWPWIVSGALGAVAIGAVAWALVATRGGQGAAATAPERPTATVATSAAGETSLPATTTRQAAAGAASPDQPADVQPADLPPNPKPEVRSEVRSDGRAGSRSDPRSNLPSATVPSAAVATANSRPATGAEATTLPGPSLAPQAGAVRAPALSPSFAADGLPSPSRGDDAPRAMSAPVGDASRSAAASSAADRVVTVAELPDDLRRELPPLAVGGSMYSPSPASRLLIVNGQVLHEGDALQPGLVLQQIRLKSAVFSFRERRFELRY